MEITDLGAVQSGARKRGGRHMRSLVTGGAGFIGSHLCERLLDDGHEVLCVDNFYSTSKANIEHLLDHPRFELLRHDVTFPLYVEVDEIYHLACPASPIHYQRDPVQTTKTTVHGIDQHAGPGQAAQGPNPADVDLGGVRRPDRAPAARGLLGHTSTRSGRARATTRASAAPRRCSSTTGASTISTSRSCGCSTPTGRGCTPTTAAWSATSSCRRSAGQPLTVYGDGSQTRSFCYVDDTVEGIVRMMDTAYEVTGPVNLGNPNEIPVGELAERVGAIAGVPVTIAHRPLPEDDPRQRQPDISLAHSLLGWKPEVDLADGLRRTVEWARHSESFYLARSA